MSGSPMTKILGIFGETTQVGTFALEEHSGRPFIAENGFSLFVLGEPRSGSFSHAAQGNLHLVLSGSAATGEKDERDPASSLLTAYQREGERVFDRLDGSFSLVFWDGERKKLYLCRDDYGTKLLYYHHDGKGKFVFSDDLNELLKVTGRRGISREALVEFLRFLDISPPYTIHDGVFFLEPERVLKVDVAGVELRDKEECQGILPEEALDSPDASEYFERIFRESITRKIEGKGKIGAFLSGGIDSSLVCAVSAGLRNDLKAFTVGFADAEFDESKVAGNVAKYLGLDHQVLVFTQDQDYAAFHEFVSKIPSPFADPAIIPTFQCFRSIADQVDLVLDGTGADTLIGIMPARHIHFILNCSRHIPRRLRNAIAKVLNFSKSTARHSDLFSFDDAAELLIRWKGWTREEISHLCKDPRDLSHTMFYRIYNGNWDKDPYALYSMLMGALPDDRIHQSSSLFGPVASFPFFDRTVQAYVRQLPFNCKYGAGGSKLLFRQVLGRYVPPEIWDVPKHGFDYPFERLLQYRGHKLVKSYLSSGSLGLHDFFDERVVDRYAARFMSGDLSVKFKVWGLVLFQAWYENYYLNI
jgi:asparagine synthase (glutamine-hydrolysing)